MGCCQQNKNQNSLEFGHQMQGVEILDAKKRNDLNSTSQDTMPSKINSQGPSVVDQKQCQLVEDKGDQIKTFTKAQNIQASPNQSTEEEIVVHPVVQPVTVSQDEEVQPKRRGLFQGTGLPLRLRFGPLWIINEQQSQMGSQMGDTLHQSQIHSRKDY